MLRGRVDAHGDSCRIVATNIRVGIPGRDLSEVPFTIDTGCSYALVRSASRLGDYRAKGVPVIKEQVELADGEQKEISITFSDVQLEESVRRGIRTALMGPVDMIGMEFLRGLDLNVRIEPGQLFSMAVPASWLADFA